MTDEPTEVEQKMDVDLSTAIGDLEEARMLTHAIRKYLALAGVPAELQKAADELAQAVESLEVQASNYACGVAA
jgi:hypothetical protein